MPYSPYTPTSTPFISSNVSFSSSPPPTLGANTSLEALAQEYPAVQDILRRYTQLSEQLERSTSYLHSALEDARELKAEKQALQQSLE
jgi:small-conductance mechanosensitive channel